LLAPTAEIVERQPSASRALARCMAESPPQWTVLAPFRSYLWRIAWRNSGRRRLDLRTFLD
jgi:hypothetical protein